MCKIQSYFTVADGIRVGDDLARFHLQNTIIQRPVFGVHGSLEAVTERFGVGDGLLVHVQDPIVDAERDVVTEVVEVTTSCTASSSSTPPSRSSSSPMSRTSTPISRTSWCGVYRMNSRQ
jgi:hypothetical protein